MLGHLTAAESRAAAALGITVESTAAPRGLLVGEMPSSISDPATPLFPSPGAPTAAAQRIMQYARLSPAEYLGALRRVNLCEADRWSASAARTRAAAVIQLAAEAGADRVVLLGSRVAAAFGLRPWSRADWVAGGALITAVSIPHPSGRNRVYNDGCAVRMAGAIIRWAAGLRSTLITDLTT